MSLAATFTADGMRPASFLPAIKCSSCGDEIEIAAMGDHKCGRAPPTPKAMPASLSNPFTLRQLNASGQMRAPPAPSPLQQSRQAPPKPSKSAPPQTRVRAPTIGSQQIPAPKAQRPAPPRIDPGAANMPFLAPRPPRSESPISPAMSARSGSSHGSKPAMLRSMTSPAPRSIFDVRPPSPELSASFDCAFPPFAPASSTGSNSRPGSSNGRRTPNSERAPSRGSNRQDSRSAAEKESSGFQTRSPLSNGGEIAWQNVSYGGNGRKGSKDEPTNQSRQLDRRRPSLPSNNMPPTIPDEPIPRPSTSHSLRSGHDRNKSVKQAPSRPARPTDEVMSPSFLDQLSSEPVMEMPSTFSPSQPPLPIRSVDRSRTFPVRQQSGEEPPPSKDLPRRPSEPIPRNREQRPTLTAPSQTAPSRVPQVEVSIERSQSRTGARMDYRMVDAPPVPRPVQQYRKDSMHTPSESGSSTTSSANSYGHNSSSGPSPASSAASSVDAFSPISQEASGYGDDTRMRVAGLNVRNQEKPGMRAEQPKARSPPKNVARPVQHQEAPILPEPISVPVAPVEQPLESPMDPAMEKRKPGRGPLATIRPDVRPALMRTATAPMLTGRPKSPQPMLPKLSVPFQPTEEYDPYKPISPQVAPRSRSKSNATRPQQLYQVSTVPTPASARPRSPQPMIPSVVKSTLQPPRARSPQPTMPPPPPIPQEVPRAPALQRKPTAGKAACRGCGFVIEGKSVKAADGRLTGRWHKTCFTCRTCHQPFATADFYVIDNHPYCEQHYHEQNGSLCRGCHRGIEGQYLETTSSSTSGSTETKYHPRCFTCHDCRQVLAEDYFEISGKVFCEKHALAAMRGQARLAGPSGVGLNPPNWKAERRTTKLMMM